MIPSALSVLLGSLSSVAAAFRGGRLWPSLAESTHSLAQVLSSRPKGRALCGPQRRDRGTIAPILSTLSFRVERPDLFFRADLWRVGSRSRGIPLPSSSVLLGFPSGVTQTYELEGAPSPASGGKGGFLRSNATNSLLLSLPFHYSALPLAFLCDLCVPSSVVSVLPSLFSSSALPLRTLRRRLPRPGRGVIFFSLFLSTFNFELSTSESITP